MAYARNMRLFLYSVLIFMTSAASAEIYRSVDENGNVIFSDTPSEGAEKIEVKEAQTVDAPSTEPFRYEPPPGEPPPRYQAVTISSPQNDQSIRANAGNVSVSMSVTPGLRRGDRLVLLMDGKQVASGSSTSVSMKNVDRGTHTLRARVIGRDGKTLASSDPVTFHLQRHSIQHPKPPPGPLNPPKSAN